MIVVSPVPRQRFRTSGVAGLARASAPRISSACGYPVRPARGHTRPPCGGHPRQRTAALGRPTPNQSLRSRQAGANSNQRVRAMTSAHGRRAMSCGRGEGSRPHRERLSAGGAAAFLTCGPTAGRTGHTRKGVCGLSTEDLATATRRQKHEGKRGVQPSFTSCLPKFSPRNNAISPFGALSIPSTTDSRYTSFFAARYLPRPSSASP